MKKHKKDNPPTLEAYRMMVKRLQAPIILPKGMTTREDIILHAALGMADEAGEIISIVKSHLYYGKPYSGKHILEELGDLFHFMMYLMLEYSWTLDDVMSANTRKLAKRYPDGFNVEDAIKRMDKSNQD